MISAKRSRQHALRSTRTDPSLPICTTNPSGHLPFNQVPHAFHISLSDLIYHLFFCHSVCYSCLFALLFLMPSSFFCMLSGFPLCVLCFVIIIIIISYFVLSAESTKFSIILWNSLPSELQKSSSLSTFKSALKSHLCT